MPCYTERTITTDLAAAHPDVLGRALTASGFSFVLQQDGATLSILRDGRQVATLRGKTLTANDEQTIKQIKQAYASEAVRTAARKYGWAVKADAQTADTLTLTRRTL